MTKRYYVTEKAAQLANELDEIAKEQDALSEEQINKESKLQQEKLNKEFNKVAEDIQELEEDNQKLKKPLDINTDKKNSDDVKRNQEDALNAIWSTPESAQDFVCSFLGSYRALPNVFEDLLYQSYQQSY